MWCGLSRGWGDKPKRAVQEDRCPLLCRLAHGIPARVIAGGMRRPKVPRLATSAERSRNNVVNRHLGWV